MDLEFKLHKAQLEIFQDPARFKVVAAGRRFGKSYLSAVMLLCEGLKSTTEYGHKLDATKPVWYVAPTYGQAKETLWNVLKELGQGVITDALEQTAVIRLINGRSIYLKGSDRPDTLRGVGLSFVVLDEYASMKPMVWEQILRPTLADVKGGALFIGTPAGKNHFYKLFTDSANKPDWKAFTFTTTVNPYIDPQEIKDAKATSTKATFKQEYEASFASAGGSTLNPELITTGPEPLDGDYFITVDPAGFESVAEATKSSSVSLDECAISIVKVGTYGWWVADIMHGRWDVRETSIKILRAAQNYRPKAVGIEKGSLNNAMQPYLKDQMLRLNTFPNITTVTHGGKSKIDRISWALQGRLEHGRIVFADKPYLEHLRDQMGDFPNPLAHDDLIDSLAYIDQIAQVSYQEDFMIDNSYAEPLDAISGY